jgi:hypothetical protein
MRFNLAIFAIWLFAACSDQSSGESVTGASGSLARFAIKNNYLYVLSSATLSVFDIAGNSFRKANEVPIGFAMETIQANGDYLYMGARDAMYIYSLQNPASPEFVFRYQHIVSCDPVVVQGNRAYVTLRSGNTCNRGANALEIIDITNPNNPRLITNYPMKSPGGLGISGNCLFVCEGKFGFKMLDVTGDRVRQVRAIESVNAYDVIVRNGSFILTGEDGIFQYSFSCDAGTLSLLSSIPVNRAAL